MLFRLSRIVLPALFAVTAFITPLTHAIENNASLMAKGEWKDPKTGLIWMRCSIGQTWTGDNCSGEPIGMNWQDANDYFELFNQDGFAGAHNWRLPNIKELSDLRQCSTGWDHKVKTVGNLSKDMIDINEVGLPRYCADGSSQPTIDISIFPNTPSKAYWSASPNANNSNYAWNVYFYYGNSYYDYNKNRYYYVRAVRSGQ